jgi:hypothetical protein
MAFLTCVFMSVVVQQCINASHKLDMYIYIDYVASIEKSLVVPWSNVFVFLTISSLISTH